MENLPTNLHCKGTEDITTSVRFGNCPFRHKMYTNFILCNLAAMSKGK